MTPKIPVVHHDKGLFLIHVACPLWVGYCSVPHHLQSGALADKTAFLWNIGEQEEHTMHGVGSAISLARVKRKE